MTREVTGDLFQREGLWYWRLQIGHSRKQALKALSEAKRRFSATAKRDPDFNRKP